MALTEEDVEVAAGEEKMEVALEEAEEGVEALAAGEEAGLVMEEEGEETLARLPQAKKAMAIIPWEVAMGPQVKAVLVLGLPGEGLEVGEEEKGAGEISILNVGLTE